MNLYEVDELKPEQIPHEATKAEQIAEALKERAEAASALQKARKRLADLRK